MYLSSADWMPRNFRRRVEVMWPVLDESLKTRVIEEILGTMRSGHAEGLAARVERQLCAATARREDQAGTQPIPLHGACAGARAGSGISDLASACARARTRRCNAKARQEAQEAPQASRRRLSRFLERARDADGALRFGVISRVGAGVATRASHGSGRAGLPHPALRLTVLLGRAGSVARVAPGADIAHEASSSSPTSRGRAESGDSTNCAKHGKVRGAARASGRCFRRHRSRQSGPLRLDRFFSIARGAAGVDCDDTTRSGCATFV